MRQIKFRGRDIETGRTVYGGYKVGRCGEPIIITNFTAAYEVTPESVAQLIGIDANGREVYEGDEVVDKFGEKYLAQLTPTLRENHEGAGGVFSKPTERFWAERRQYTPLTLVE